MKITLCLLLAFPRARSPHAGGPEGTEPSQGEPAALQTFPDQREIKRSEELKAPHSHSSGKQIQR